MPQTQRPHILLITTDQQRADCLGINGNRYLETPNLDYLASTGVNFSKAYSTCPVCIPARRTLLTGQSPDTHGLRRYQDGVDFNPPATLPGCLSDAGYQTQLIGKMHLHPQGKRFGFDNIILSETSHSRPRSGFQQRNDYARWLRDKGVTQHPHSHGINGNGRLCRPWGMDEQYHINSWMAETAVRFLTEERDPSCPLFLHLSFVNPHPPLVPLRDYFERYLAKDIPAPCLGEWCPPPAGKTVSPDSVTGPFDPAILQRATAAYYALINHVDDCIARILELWRGYGSPDAGSPLYIIFSSDHGEMLGDHQLFRKSLGYESSARVPFFITSQNAPIRSAGSDALVCWEDIAPTILDLAGVEVPACMEGSSLAPLVRGEESFQHRDHIFGQCDGWHHNLWVVTPRWKYLWFPSTNEEQLFDLTNDPRECRDLSGSSDEIHVIRELLASHIANREDLTFDRKLLTPCENKPPTVFWPS